MRQQKEALEQQTAALEKEKKKILSQAKEEARSILKEARETANQVQKELKELSKLESLGERNKRFDQNRRRLKEKESKYAERMVREVNTSSPVRVEDLKIGDRVKLLTPSGRCGR